MNKSEVVVHEFSFFQKLKQRKNIILM
ncbi:hypothetical protein KKG31_06470 [Patescibacteria group bacterium]|nr:hypothetical protein [Patescibacteria group bacterium]MBU1758739.1 hypothetical protein [Patescibacteria group bacterium]